jgi:hypothetical protein
VSLLNPYEASYEPFDKREEGFELKFAHEEEVRFRARARRNKMLGLWAAEKLGLASAAADGGMLQAVFAPSGEFRPVGQNPAIASR